MEGIKDLEVMKKFAVFLVELKKKMGKIAYMIFKGLTSTHIKAALLFKDLGGWKNSATIKGVKFNQMGLIKKLSCFWIMRIDPKKVDSVFMDALRRSFRKIYKQNGIYFLTVGEFYMKYSLIQFYY